MSCTVRAPILALLALQTAVVFGQNSSPVDLVPDTSKVPTVLFDIQLGGVYEFPADETGVGTFPIAKMTATAKFLGSGISIYFQPLRENPVFRIVSGLMKATNTPERRSVSTCFQCSQKTSKD